jgi:hypothetical protein
MSYESVLENSNGYYTMTSLWVALSLDLKTKTINGGGASSEVENITEFAKKNYPGTIIKTFDCFKEVERLEYEIQWWLVENDILGSDCVRCMRSAISTMNHYLSRFIIKVENDRT